MDKKEVLENLINADKTYRAQISDKTKQVKAIVENEVMGSRFEDNSYKEFVERYKEYIKNE
ncbi:MAG: hypothetical protein HUJ59_03800 [Bacilli bacterium]|nr:hypothetical protein [Bacilli bacterium]